MISFKKFLLEKKNDISVLYHLASWSNMEHILDTNELKPYRYPNISTTRSKTLNSYLGSDGRILFRIVLDGLKLSKKYKIKSYVYKSSTLGKLTNEEESQILMDDVKKIENIKQYIIKIEIIKPHLEALTKTFTSDYEYFKRNNFTPEKISEYEKDNIEFMKKINSILNKLKKFGVDIEYVDI